jgi:hypothetical protein
MEAGNLYSYSSSCGDPTTAETYFSISSNPTGNVAEMNNRNIVQNMTYGLYTLEQHWQMFEGYMNR